MSKAVFDCHGSLQGHLQFKKNRGRIRYVSKNVNG